MPSSKIEARKRSCKTQRNYDNRKFWKVVKPLLSNEIVFNENITLVEGEKIIKTDQINPKVLNKFFSNTKNLEIPQYNQVDPICQDIKDSVIEAIMKYRYHPSIIVTKERCTISKFSFSFHEKMTF